jgi:urease accessory protein
MPGQLGGELRRVRDRDPAAAIRLSVIGQTDGQRVIATLHAPVRQAAARAAVSTLADVGGATLASDLGSLLHETQYSRLFRS